jgi:Ca2+-binding RTX toxin-like protein
MTSKNRRLLTAMMTTALAGLAVARQAQAAFPVDTPYGSQAVSVLIGTDPRFGPIVCYQSHANGSIFTVYSLGTTAGLDQDYVVRAASGADFIQIFSSGTSTQCGGYQFDPLKYNGKRLDVKGSGGNDTIICGAGRSDCFGDTGKDTMQNFSPVGRLIGGASNDRLSGSSSITTDRLSGGTGTDCLDDPGNRHTEFDCGADADFFVSPASGAISCETPVTTCPVL